MTSSQLLKKLLLVLACSGGSVRTHDVLLEAKGAYFLASGSHFKNIYNRGGALWGLEATFNGCGNAHWHGFASIDFLRKQGHSIGFATPTTVTMVPLALGVKYFVPFSCGDFYVGLGFQPVHLKTDNCSPFVIQQTNQWGFGGIAKIGTYFDLPHHLFIDLCINYSFVTVSAKNNRCTTPLVVVPIRANISGADFGIGLGYRFN